MAKRTVNFYDLKALVLFLNSDVGKLDEKEISKKRMGRSVDESLTWNGLDILLTFRPRPNVLLKLREDIKAHVLALLDIAIPAEEALRRVTDKINDLSLMKSRQVPLSSEMKQFTHMRSRAVMVELKRVAPPRKNRKKKGRTPPKVKRIAVVEYNHDVSTEQMFYRVLDDAIQNNTIYMLRNCLNCQKFFVGAKRLTYCSDKCEMTFNNRRRTKSGYFAEKAREARR